MGDRNARFGTAVRQLPASLDMVECSYPFIAVQVQRNDYAIALLGI